MLLDPAGMRQDYNQSGLAEAAADANPFRQFSKWFEQATQADLVEPNAMTLATADDKGVPSARMVLMKGFDEAGFTFFTNYESRKAKELAANPYVSLMFWWDRLHRQVRIEGKAEKLPAADSERYFASRPYGSRIGAVASPQSQVVEDRDALRQHFSEVSAAHPEHVPRPEHWGGYLVVPMCFEFWQGQESRLHDRLRYRLAENSWIIERLAP